jgi:7-cyano-7-deazaguanine synthase in queuosine biosynthesis
MSLTENPKTLMLLSGGMNSATVLFYLARLVQRPVLEAMTFNTASATNEHGPARANANRAGVPSSLWNLHIGPFMDMGLMGQPDNPPPKYGDDKLELALMFIQAAWRAKQMGYERIATGHIESELPMSHEDFLDLTGMVASFAEMPHTLFEMPLWNETKAGIFAMAKELNVLAEITVYTSSCLLGDEETKQDSWGFGCGNCAGCIRRRAAWELYIKGLKK